MSFTSPYFLDIWQMLTSILDTQKLAEVAFTTKLIWQKRSETIHQKGFYHLNVISSNAKADLQTFNRALSSTSQL